MSTLVSMMSDENRWDYLLAAIGRLEDRLNKLIENDANKAALIHTLNEQVRQVEADFDLKIKDVRSYLECKIKPMEAIHQKMNAWRIVMVAVFGGMIALSALIGSWYVIRDFLIR